MGGRGEIPLGSPREPDPAEMGPWPPLQVLRGSGDKHGPCRALRNPGHGGLQGLTCQGLRDPKRRI